MKWPSAEIAGIEKLEPPTTGGLVARTVDTHAGRRPRHEVACKHVELPVRVAGDQGRRHGDEGHVMAVGRYRRTTPAVHLIPRTVDVDPGRGAPILSRTNTSTTSFVSPASRSTRSSRTRGSGRRPIVGPVLKPFAWLPAPSTLTGLSSRPGCPARKRRSASWCRRPPGSPRWS